MISLRLPAAFVIGPVCSLLASLSLWAHNRTGLAVEYLRCLFLEIRISGVFDHELVICREVTTHKLTTLLIPVYFCPTTRTNYAGGDMATTSGSVRVPHGMFHLQWGQKPLAGTRLSA
jgi:hypothetical protein